MRFPLKWRLLPYLKENDSIISREKNLYHVFEPWQETLERRQCHCSKPRKGKNVKWILKFSPYTYFPNKLLMYKNHCVVKQRGILCPLVVSNMSTYRQQNTERRSHTSKDWFTQCVDYRLIRKLLFKNKTACVFFVLTGSC